MHQNVKLYLLVELQLQEISAAARTVLTSVPCTCQRALAEMGAPSQNRLTWPGCSKEQRCSNLYEGSGWAWGSHPQPRLGLREHRHVRVRSCCHSSLPQFLEKDCSQPVCCWFTCRLHHTEAAMAKDKNKHPEGCQDEGLKSQQKTSNRKGLLRKHRVSGVL